MHASTTANSICSCCPAQVFEYLTTDLKKYMDRNGKGPNFPLQKTVIKVRLQKPTDSCLSLLTRCGGQHGLQQCGR